MRLIDGQDHLQRRAAVVDAAERLAVFLDRVQEVADDPDVAKAQAAVFERLGDADAGARDRLPVRLALAEEPGRLLDKTGEWQTAGAELDHAFRAVESQPEAVAGAVLDLGAEGAD